MSEKHKNPWKHRPKTFISCSGVRIRLCLPQLQKLKVQLSNSLLSETDEAYTDTEQGKSSFHLPILWSLTSPYVSKQACFDPLGTSLMVSRASALAGFVQGVLPFPYIYWDVLKFIKCRCLLEVPIFLSLIQYGHWRAVTVAKATLCKLIRKA